MRELLTEIHDLLVGDGWSIRVSDDQHVIIAKYVGEAGEWLFFVQEHAELEQLVFYSVYPEKCPDDKRTEMILLLSMINDGLVVGNFEFGFDTDEIRCRTSMEFKIVTLTPEIARSLIYKNLSLMDTYSPAVTDLIQHDVGAVNALQAIGR